MPNLEIAIVEDELLVAHELKSYLEELGHKVQGIYTSGTQFKEGLKKKQPDIALLDVRIRGKISGIDLAHYLNANYEIPFIFVTSFADPVTLKKAMETRPYGYLVKPFSQADIFAAVEYALSTHDYTPSQLNRRNKVSETVSVYIPESRVHVDVNKIYWLRSVGNYVELHTENEKYLTRNSLKDLINHLPVDQFARCHRSFVVNKIAIKKFKSRSFILHDGEEIPISRFYSEMVRIWYY